MEHIKHIIESGTMRVPNSYFSFLAIAKDLPCNLKAGKNPTMKHGVKSIYQINLIMVFRDNNCFLFGRSIQHPQIFQQPCFRN